MNSADTKSFRKTSRTYRFDLAPSHWFTPLNGYQTNGCGRENRPLSVFRFSPIRYIRLSSSFFVWFFLRFSINHAKIVWNCFRYYPGKNKTQRSAKYRKNWRWKWWWSYENLSSFEWCRFSDTNQMVATIDSRNWWHRSVKAARWSAYCKNKREHQEGEEHIEQSKTNIFSKNGIKTVYIG